MIIRMGYRKLFEKWKNFVALLNKKGVPAPTIRDPKTGQGSVSLTLVFISSAIVIVGIIGNWSAKLGNVDMANAMQFFWTACTLYWGRKFQYRPDDTSPKAQDKIDNPDA